MFFPPPAPPPLSLSDTGWGGSGCGGGGLFLSSFESRGALWFCPGELVVFWDLDAVTANTAC